MTSVTFSMLAYTPASSTASLTLSSVALHLGHPGPKTLISMVSCPSKLSSSEPAVAHPFCGGKHHDNGTKGGGLFYAHHTADHQHVGERKGRPGNLGVFFQPVLEVSQQISCVSAARSIRKLAIDPESIFMGCNQAPASSSIFKCLETVAGLPPRPPAAHTRTFFYAVAS